MIPLIFEQFSAMIATNEKPDLWYPNIIKYFEKYQINTPNRIAAFISQSAYESNDYKTITENLKYSAKRLRVVWPKRFPSDSFAAQYAFNQEKIANYVYANRMGNGDAASGDGWKFIGRGLKQLTGRNNYTAFANSIGKTLDETVEYSKTYEGAVESACWFWKTNNLEKYADVKDIKGLTEAINGGLNGYDERLKKFNECLSILNAVSIIVLRKGSSGQEVKNIQAKLGIAVDGNYGPITEAAVMKWQKSQNTYITGFLTVTQYKAITG